MTCAFPCVGDWSAYTTCNHCVSGTQTRSWTVSQPSINGGACPLLGQTESQNCVLSPCPYAWDTTAWTVCEITQSGCVSGVKEAAQTRTVTCQEQGTVVDDSQCPGQKPVVYQKCYGVCGKKNFPILFSYFASTNIFD